MISPSLYDMQLGAPTGNVVHDRTHMCWQTPPRLAAVDPVCCCTELRWWNRFGDALAVIRRITAATPRTMEPDTVSTPNAVPGMLAYVLWRAPQPPGPPWAANLLQVVIRGCNHRAHDQIPDDLFLAQRAHVFSPPSGIWIGETSVYNIYFIIVSRRPSHAGGARLLHSA